MHTQTYLFQPLPMLRMTINTITSPTDVSSHLPDCLKSKVTSYHRSGTRNDVLPDEPAAPKLRATLMPCCAAVGMSCLGRKLHRGGRATCRLGDDIFVLLNRQIYPMGSRSYVGMGCVSIGNCACSLWDICWIYEDVSRVRVGVAFY